MKNYKLTPQLKKQIELAVQQCVSTRLDADPLKDIYECRSYDKLVNEYEPDHDFDLANKILAYEDEYLGKLINSLSSGDIEL